MTPANDIEVLASDRPGEAHAIRRTVFVEEQGVSEPVEFDDRDGAARHFVARVGSDAAGTARVRLVDADTAKVERVAVLPEFRGRGVGDAVMRAAHEYARNENRSRALLHAQTRVAEFYESLGYESLGPVDDETGIPHVEMVLAL
ncbi:Predicted N-acyltransferase, GNAT family [Halomicrobium zhouii]|uniref:Predicted N-acyltransferase, GNAT family n=1 Tax=Halomicrobium zhouii TaxID=767519 RepID=A0A1I6LU30_9EURY|nr:GNAT family N-acetyltransferase [Halomicrobium zhouii]SFS06971.1 Predicted N-acyltransferase, GNAT family [Halomicrobium zhouii]